jgi:hypothetical protein
MAQQPQWMYPPVAMVPVVGAAQAGLWPYPRPGSVLTPLLQITLPEDDGDTEEEIADRHVAPIIFALQAMVAVNLWHIRRSLKRALKGKGVPIPPLYASGIYYKEDPPGEENWRDIYGVLANGTGDCDQICSWRVAECLAAGIWAEPVIKYQMVPREVMIQLGHPPAMVPPQGVLMIHVCVRFADGSIEDPSKNLGMGGSFTNGV